MDFHLHPFFAPLKKNAPFFRWIRSDQLADISLSSPLFFFFSCIFSSLSFYLFEFFLAVPIVSPFFPVLPVPLLCDIDKDRAIVLIRVRISFSTSPRFWLLIFPFGGFRLLRSRLLYPERLF